MQARQRDVAQKSKNCDANAEHYDASAENCGANIKGCGAKTKNYDAKNAGAKTKIERSYGSNETKPSVAVRGSRGSRGIEGRTACTGHLLQGRKIFGQTDDRHKARQRSTVACKNRESCTTMNGGETPEFDNLTRLAHTERRSRQTAKAVPA